MRRRQHGGMTKRSTAREYARRWTAEEALTALAELQGSGLSVAAFTRGAGLDSHRLRAWQRRLGASGTAIAPVFIEVARPAPRIAEDGKLGDTDLRAMLSSAAIRLEPEPSWCSAWRCLPTSGSTMVARSVAVSNPRI